MTAAAQKRWIPLKRFFLWRRRIDPVLFTLATATVMLPGNISVYLFSIFAGIGVYLIIGRHRSMRRIDMPYLVAAATLATGSIAIGFLNGSLPEDFRWASYPVYYLALVPLAVGTVLVRDPLRQFVIGARLAIPLIAIWGTVAVAMGGYRYGYGSNEANAAFVITFIAIVSRLQVETPPRWLGNSVSFFYLAIIPLLATGTRATMAVFAIAIVLDVWSFATRRDLSLLPGAPRKIAALIVMAVLVALISSIFGNKIWIRVYDSAQDIVQFAENPDTTEGSISIRAVLWEAAIDVIRDNPAFGVGGLATRPALQAEIPAQYKERLSNLSFSHNFILDEAMQRGLVGLALMIGFFGFVTKRLASGGDRDKIENVVLLGLMAATFGSLHHLLLVDKHVALIGIYLIVLVTAATRSQKRRLQPSANAS